MESWQKHFTSPRGELRHRCALPGCTSTPGSASLKKCSGCKSVRYCGQDHQADHLKEHNTACTNIQRLQADLDTIPPEIRNATTSTMTLFELDARQFDPHVERFFITLKSLSEEKRNLGTLDSCRLAAEDLEHMLRMHDWPRGDENGPENILPALYLRLDEDQKCHDFIRWWCFGAARPLGEPVTARPTFPEYVRHSWSNPIDHDVDHSKISDWPTYLSSAILLYLKLLIDIRNIKITRKILEKLSPLPGELFTHVEAAVIRSSVSARLLKEKYQDIKELDKLEIELAARICILGRKLDNVDSHLIDFLYHPSPAVKDFKWAPSQWNSMEKSEAQRHRNLEGRGVAKLHFNLTHKAWWEIEGALEFLTVLRQVMRQAAAEDTTALGRARLAGIMNRGKRIGLWGHVKTVLEKMTL